MQENEIQSVEGYKPVTLKGSLQIHRFAGIIIKDFENKEKTISMKEIAELLDCDVKDVIITK